MGELTKRMLAKGKVEDVDDQEGQRPDGDLPPDERRALEKMRKESAAAGSDLQGDGEGGLLPSLVLGVMRRDKFRCKECHELGDRDTNLGIGVHHTRQHIQDPKIARKGASDLVTGNKNDPAGIETICGRCHDKVHNEDRDENPGEPDAEEIVEG